MTEGSTTDQLVSIIEQTTGWQPSTASIREVMATCGMDTPVTEEKALGNTGEKMSGQARANFRNMIKKP